jgi:pyrimidine operon attenuation protein/uracil phosphoribosyltransferase
MTMGLDSKGIQRALARMAQEILESHEDVENLLLVGIHSGGVPLANRLASLIEATEGQRPFVGEMDITLYRDDLYTGLEKPVLGETKLPIALRGAHVVLVDDVLFTGRTIRAAMDEMMDFGRPDRIQLAVLVDRGHRELPIQANFIGRKFETQKSDQVTVCAGSVPSPADCVSVSENGGENR